MSLLRTAFWLSIVILLLPTGRDAKTQNEADKVSLNQAVSAANETASDMAGFCERNPGVCATGKNAVKVFADKAKYGANMIFEWAAGGEGNPADGKANQLGDQADARSAIEGKVDKSEKGDLVRPSYNGRKIRPGASQNTLSRDDLAPAWNGPRKKAA